SDLLKVLAPNHGPDVRMSNGILLGSNQNEFQIDLNPTNSLNAIGTSNDGGVAGVGIFVSQNGGMTWTSADASTYGVPSACCDPGVAFGTDGSVYAIILDTSPELTYIIKSTDGGVTWRPPTSVSTPDRPNVAVDPSNANIAYITYTDFNQPAGRIAGYKSTDGGATWGAEFLIGDPTPATSTWSTPAATWKAPTPAAARPASTATPSSAAPPTAAPPGPPLPRSTPTHKARTSITPG